DAVRIEFARARSRRGRGTRQPPHTRSSLHEQIESKVAAELLRNTQQPGTASGVGVLARETEVRRSGNLRRELARVLEIARRPIALNCKKGAAIPHGHRRVERE